ncbi:MAG TPA: amidohydrolase family protein [Gemmataceae bacterium]|jgi:predicted TIM-barrel fold metal-dependent hydrolase|nr:amidohydrolase family protein [Gemmataceae bacterium]
MRGPENRRQFLAETATLTLAEFIPNIAAAYKEDRKMLPIIDTHQHLWDLKKFRLPWIKPGSVLAKDHLMTDYLRATEGLNIVKTIYMEVDLDPAQQQEEADFVIETCKRGNTPMAAGVISGRPSSDAFAKYITPFKGNRYIKGVRQILHAQAPAGLCLDPNFMKGVRLLGELGLSFDLCMRPAELGDGVKLVDACPDTRFILDHCGNGDVSMFPRPLTPDPSPPERRGEMWKRGMEELAKRKNVVACKVSGIIVSATPGKWTPDDLAPIVNHTLDTFGPDRVMFGGDWPVCTQVGTFKQWLSALQSIVKNRSEEQQRKLFHDNAVRVYGLN